MSYGARANFYHSKAWKQVRRNVWLKQNCLCAICNKPVYVDGITDYMDKSSRRTGIVHHKEHLNDTNLYDDSITLDENTNFCFGDGTTFSQLPYDINGNIRVLQVYWKSMRKIQEIKYYDPETGKVIAEYASQKEALLAIGKDPKKAGLSDSINGRTSTHIAYGFKWFFKDEWEAMGGKLPK